MGRILALSIFVLTLIVLVAVVLASSGQPNLASGDQVARFQPAPVVSGDPGACACSPITSSPPDAGTPWLVSLQLIMPEPRCTGRPNPDTPHAAVL